MKKKNMLKWCNRILQIIIYITIGVIQKVRSMRRGRGIIEKQTIKNRGRFFMLKIFIYNLLWFAEYQCKRVIKFNLSDLIFLDQFRRSWKWLNWKNLLLTLIAVTRITNLVRWISQFRCFKFPIYIFYFRPALSFKKQVICWDEQYS